jgi:PKD repeat protein
MANAEKKFEKPSWEIGDWWKYECRGNREIEEYDITVMIEIEMNVTAKVSGSIIVDGNDYWKVKMEGEGKMEYKVEYEGKWETLYNMSMEVNGSIYFKKDDFSLLNSTIDYEESPIFNAAFDPPLKIMEFPVWQGKEWTNKSTAKIDIMEYSETQEINLKGECTGIVGNICSIRHTDVKSGNYTIERWWLDLGLPRDIKYYDKSHKLLFEAHLIGNGENKPPIASFTVDRNGLIVNVDASSSYDPDGYITKYKWDFGDNVTGIKVKTSHTYLKEENYTITLTVTDNSSVSNTTSREIEVTIEKNDTNTPGFEFLFALLAAIIAICNRKWRESRK